MSKVTFPKYLFNTFVSLGEVLAILVLGFNGYLGLLLDAVQLYIVLYFLKDTFKNEMFYDLAVIIRKKIQKPKVEIIPPP